MKEIKVYPKIAGVEARAGKRLLVRFRNGVTKLYDCTRVLKKYPMFAPLHENDALFRQARAETHGYAVVWNDEMDIAQSELWEGGKVVRETPANYGRKATKKAGGRKVAAKSNRGRKKS